MPNDSVDQDSQRQQLNAGPPRPPKNNKNIMQMGAGNSSDLGVDTSNPVVQAMSSMGIVRRELMKLSTILPGLAQPFQQIIQGLESVVPQQVADLAAGNVPGSGGAGMGA